MSEQDSFLTQLWHRRVPQIVGVYVGGSWLAIEIGEWLTEQAGWPSVYGLYLFVFLIALLPAVILLAWRHGAPGKDEWRVLEKIAISSNLLLAFALVMLVVQARPPLDETSTVEVQSAVIERKLIDETGQEQVFQVAREGFGITVTTLFWPQAEASEVAWENYAAPWLLSVGLDQDPLINFSLAYDRSLVERLVAAGFEDGLGEPLSLGLEIASDLGSDYLIRGNYSRLESGYELTAELYDVGSAALLDRFTAIGDSLIAAVEALSEQLAERLVGDLDRGTAEFRPIGLAESTTENEAVLVPFIRGLNEVVLNSNFEAGQAALKEAVALDPSFAPGWAWLQQIQRQIGDMAAANTSIEQALAHDYKLDTSMRFILRANQYAVVGDVERAIRVLRMWTEVQPYSLRAWTALTRNLMLIGELDEARDSNEKARTIDPDRASLDRTRAEIEELAGEYELASELLEAYVAAEPGDDAAWISLGNVRERSGDAEGARDAFERATFVASNNFTARQRLLRLEGRTGDPESALRDYQRALTEPRPPSEEASLAFDLVSLLVSLGQMQEIIEVMDTHGDAVRETLPPLARTLTITGFRVGALTSLGRNDEALELLTQAEQSVPRPFGALLESSRITVFENLEDIESAETSLDALREFMEAYEMPGQNVQLRIAQARVASMKAEYAEALGFLGDAREFLRGTSLSLLTEFGDSISLQQADYLIEADRPAEALEAINSLLAIHPNSGQARLIRARALRANGNTDEAWVALSDLLEFWASASPDYMELEQAKALAETWK
ncbi:MAG: tetratricopeptide repeat protein [Wenzhouxiangellaceae bacterium]